MFLYHYCCYKEELQELNGDETEPSEGYDSQGALGLPGKAVRNTAKTNR